MSWLRDPAWRPKADGLVRGCRRSSFAGQSGHTCAAEVASTPGDVPCAQNFSLARAGPTERQLHVRLARYLLAASTALSMQRLRLTRVPAAAWNHAGISSLSLLA